MPQGFDTGQVMYYGEVMIANGEFSQRDWELAPIYQSPINKTRAVVLDFEQLRQMAREEESSGAFRATPDQTFAKAPLFIDDLPAAFYQVKTSHPEYTPNHNTTDRETIVVVDGVLKLAINDGRGRSSSLENAFCSGHVVEVSQKPVSMQAVGLIEPVRCLALALYREQDMLTSRSIEILT
jgi:DNA-binding transcriptional LysR family regulator